MAKAQKTARFIRDLVGFMGVAKLYKVSPAIEFTKLDWRDGADKKPIKATTEYVAVSAIIDQFSGPETCIFPCDAEGEVQDWAELDGSYRGDLDHEAALRNGGYKIVTEVS